ncbi:MAG: tetratricopeptide repeat protein [Holophaga sp.]|nr:tetratricopeptide repeat protein [Holophaga sp.]
MKPQHARMLKQAWSLDRSGQAEQALAAYQAFLRVEPRSAVGWADLGGLCLVLGRLDEAQRACRQALQIDPGHRTAQINLAGALVDLGRLDEAETLCRRALALDPQSMDGLLALGKCLIRKGDQAQGRMVLREARIQGLARGAAPELLKHVSAMQGDWVALREDLERGLLHFSGAERDHEEAHIRLLFGELARGWSLNEARLKIPGLILPERHFSEPRWNGEPFPGRTLLLHWEQGFGDTVMFVRYAARVKALGGRVLLAAQRELADLLATCPGVDAVIPHGDPLPPFDLQIPLLSLPQVFGTELGSIPAEIPYLGVPQRVPNREAILRVLADAAGKVKVGLAWAGKPEHKRDRERSLAGAALAPLAALPGVAWHSFQLGGGQAAPLPGLVSLAPLLSSFSDTAYALSGMDLVICVDTALAHLAGAMGIPALVLLPFVPDFRWLLHRDDSPWYPSLRLYRQPLPGDWAAVIGKLVADLNA